MAFAFARPQIPAKPSKLTSDDLRPSALPSDGNAL
jgi:hypothetical protein